MAYDVAKAFKRIEDELIDSMMRNLGRHNAEEALEGFDWTQWQVEQLRSLEEYRKNNQEKYGPEFKRINERIGKSIEWMGAKGENEQEKEILRAIDKGHVPPIKREGNLEGTFFGVNNRKLDALLDATQNDFQRAEIAVLRRADDQYRRIIFDAQVYANTGAATYGKAIDMATKDFLMRGIDCIEYKNGARHTISDYADMYVKTAQTRAYLAGEGKMREEWGEHYVIVNKRGDVTCPKCAKWVGRVLIDDVYSGGKPDGKTPLLSEAMAQGFLHPRCKDIFTTYFPGISTPPDPATKKEIRQAERAEKAEARQNTAELMQEKWERRAKYQMDPAGKRVCATRANEWNERRTGKVLRKSITIDDFSTLKELLGDNAKDRKYHISDKVLDHIAEALDRLESFSRFNSVKVKTLEKGKVFDTVLIPNGTWYSCELQINGSFFDGLTLEQVEGIIRNSDITVCDSLDECVLHEDIHARSAKGGLISRVNRINETEGEASISETAGKDMLETLAEAGVLRERGEYDKLPEEVRERIDEAAKDLNLW